MFKNLKKKVRENQDTVVAVAFYAACVVGLAGLVVLASKEADKINAINAEREQKLIDAISRGDTILPNPDGSFWILPKQS